MNDLEERNRELGRLGREYLKGYWVGYETGYTVGLADGITIERKKRTEERGDQMNEKDKEECNKILSKDGYLTTNEIQYLLEKLEIAPEDKKEAIK